jgi:hypothetical protein
MQTHEGTVTFKCEGCGVRKPEAERYRSRSAFTVWLTYDRLFRS